MGKPEKSPGFKTYLKIFIIWIGLAFLTGFFFAILIGGQPEAGLLVIFLVVTISILGAVIHASLIAKRRGTRKQLALIAVTGLALCSFWMVIARMDAGCSYTEQQARQAVIIYLKKLGRPAIGLATKADSADWCEYQFRYDSKTAPLYILSKKGWVTAMPQ